MLLQNIAEIQQTTRFYIPDDVTLISPCCENPKSYVAVYDLAEIPYFVRSCIV
jgi:hypothetical protein